MNARRGLMFALEFSSIIGKSSIYFLIGKWELTLNLGRSGWILLFFSSCFEDISCYSSFNSMRYKQHYPHLIAGSADTERTWEICPKVYLENLNTEYLTRGYALIFIICTIDFKSFLKVWELAAWASSRNLCETQILRFYPRPTGVGPSNLCLKKPCRWFCGTRKF